MSLVVDLNRFKVLESKREKYARLEFRGEVKISHLLYEHGEMIFVNERFEWAVTRPVNPGEVLILELLVRGRWRAPRSLGLYTLGLQLLVAEGHLSVTDTLIGDHNHAVPVFVDMDIRYIAPVSRQLLHHAGCSSRHSLATARGSGQSSALVQHAPVLVHQARRTDSRPNTALFSSDEELGLEEIERNVADIERSCLGQRRFDVFKTGKRLLRRGFSSGADAHAEPIYESKRTSTLKTMRTFMRLGKQQQHGDEIAFLEDGAGPSSEPDPPPRRASVSSDEILVDSTASRVDTSLRKKKLMQVLDRASPSALKATDFQVCVTIIEARQLAGLNMDPVVCIQIGDVRKYTSVKESTNCPYYNEYFVFDFHMPPIMLFDKIITLSVLQARNILRANKLLGSFKLDVATVWAQPERQFYHKWALLTDPDDVSSGAKGYLKCDISVIGKGDAVQIPTKSEKDEDDIEANLLLPDGVPIERQCARFVVKIYRADGLPKMNYSVLANVKRAFTGESPDLVDPYVQVCFAGMTGTTSVKKSCYSPVWNEQVVFTEMFPPLCQRIRIQLRDNDPVHPNVIGTHFIDLKSISNDGEKGFLPTFGPAYVYLYGSTRDYSLIDQHANLNSGIGEGVAYRARLLVAIRTEIIDNVECLSSAVELEPALPISEPLYGKPEEFFLFASVFDANMIEKRLADKPLQFELSIGNAGNSLDGTAEPMKRAQDLEYDIENISPDTGYWQSTTPPTKATSSDKSYYYLPYWDYKQCMHVRSVWPDQRRRMYNTNLIATIIDRFEESLWNIQEEVETDAGADNTSVAALKSALDMTSRACATYVKHANASPLVATTKLDVERMKVCVYEIEQVGIMTRNLKALITKHSIKDRLRTAFTYLNKLKQLCEDPQHSMPDIFIWLISNGKRLAYQRIPARDIIYSDHHYESGRFCGKMQTLFLKWPGKKTAAPSGWAIPAKIYVYMWLGLLQDKRHYIDGLPKGYELNSELRHADKLRSNAPSAIFYAEKHTFQLRAYVYQARSLIGSDSSGLSDPFAKVIIGECSASTQVIDETLSPTWDELLVFDDILLYSTMQQIKSDPPTIVIEIFDQDKVGKSEFIGRTLAKPYVKAFGEPYVYSQYPHSLEWYQITRGDDQAGELLATFELLEIPAKLDASILPELPSPRIPNGKLPPESNKGPILPVPRGIRPTLSKYRIEILSWGLRDLKRIHLLSVDKPRVDIECAGNIIYSAVISNVKRNPNFNNTIKFVDVELPDQDLYRPPLTIRVFDLRSFGRTTLVGTHTINSIHKYIYTPMSKREREAEERKKSLLKLQNVDLRAKSDTQEDSFTFENEKESCPLLLRERATVSYGSGVKATQKRIGKREGMKKRRESTESALDDDDSSKDWWTKYFASVESMIEEEKEAKGERQGLLGPQALINEMLQEEAQSPRHDRDRTKLRRPQSPRKESPTLQKKNEVPKSALIKIYPYELEEVPQFEDFKEWLQTFELYRGKKTCGDSEDESRVVGVFKGAIKVYKWPLPKGIDDHTIMGFDPNYGFFQGVPNNDPIHVLVRVYIVKATDLHPMDLNGKADPYIVLHLGSKRISDKENYVSKQLNPVFGKCFEIEATFPQDSMLSIQVLDWDLLGSDDLIGETKVDLENRFYSRHRATCGLPRKYEECGARASRNVGRYVPDGHAPTWAPSGHIGPQAQVLRNAGHHLEHR